MGWIIRFFHCKPLKLTTLILLVASSPSGFSSTEERTRHKTLKDRTRSVVEAPYPKFSEHLTLTIGSGAECTNQFNLSERDAADLKEFLNQLIEARYVLKTDKQSVEVFTIINSLLNLFRYQEDVDGTISRISINAQGTGSSSTLAKSILSVEINEILGKHFEKKGLGAENTKTGPDLCEASSLGADKSFDSLGSGSSLSPVERDAIVKSKNPYLMLPSQNRKKVDAALSSPARENGQLSAEDQAANYLRGYILSRSSSKVRAGQTPLYIHALESPSDSSFGRQISEELNSRLRNSDQPQEHALTNKIREEMDSYRAPFEKRSPWLDAGMDLLGVAGGAGKALLSKATSEGTKAIVPKLVRAVEGFILVDKAQQLPEKVSRAMSSDRIEEFSNRLDPLASPSNATRFYDMLSRQPVVSAAFRDFDVRLPDGTPISEASYSQLVSFVDSDARTPAQENGMSETDYFARRYRIAMKIAELQASNEPGHNALALKLAKMDEQFLKTYGVSEKSNAHGEGRRTATGKKTEQGSGRLPFNSPQNQKHDPLPMKDSKTQLAESVPDMVSALYISDLVERGDIEGAKKFISDNLPTPLLSTAEQLRKVDAGIRKQQYQSGTQKIESLQALTGMLAAAGVIKDPQVVQALSCVFQGAQIALGVATGMINPTQTVTQLFNLASQIMGIGGKSEHQQVMEKLEEISNQIRDLRTELKSLAGEVRYDIKRMQQKIIEALDVLDAQIQNTFEAQQKNHIEMGRRMTRQNEMDRLGFEIEDQKEVSNRESNLKSLDDKRNQHYQGIKAARETAEGNLITEQSDPVGLRRIETEAAIKSANEIAAQFETVVEQGSQTYGGVARIEKNVERLDAESAERDNRLTEMEIRIGERLSPNHFDYVSSTMGIAEDDLRIGIPFAPANRVAAVSIKSKELKNAQFAGNSGMSLHEWSQSASRTADLLEEISHSNLQGLEPSKRNNLNALKRQICGTRSATLPPKLMSLLEQAQDYQSILKEIAPPTSSGKPAVHRLIEVLARHEAAVEGFLNVPNDNPTIMQQIAALNRFLEQTAPDSSDVDALNRELAKWEPATASDNVVTDTVIAKENSEFINRQNGRAIERYEFPIRITKKSVPALFNLAASHLKGTINVSYVKDVLADTEFKNPRILPVSRERSELEADYYGRVGLQLSYEINFGGDWKHSVNSTRTVDFTNPNSNGNNGRFHLGTRRLSLEVKQPGKDYRPLEDFPLRAEDLSQIRQYQNNFGTNLGAPIGVVALDAPPEAAWADVLTTIKEVLPAQDAHLATQLETPLRIPINEYQVVAQKLRDHLQLQADKHGKVVQQKTEAKSDQDRSAQLRGAHWITQRVFEAAFGDHVFENFHLSMALKDLPDDQSMLKLVNKDPQKFANDEIYRKTEIRKLFEPIRRLANKLTTENWAQELRFKRQSVHDTIRRLEDAITKLQKVEGCEEFSRELSAYLVKRKENESDRLGSYWTTTKLPRLDPMVSNQINGFVTDWLKSIEQLHPDGSGPLNMEASLTDLRDAVRKMASHYAAYQPEEAVKALRDLRRNYSGQRQTLTSRPSLQHVLVPTSDLNAPDAMHSVALDKFTFDQGNADRFLSKWVSTMGRAPTPEELEKFVGLVDAITLLNMPPSDSKSASSPEFIDQARSVREYAWQSAEKRFFDAFSEHKQQSLKFGDYSGDLISKLVTDSMKLHNAGEPGPSELLEKGLSERAQLLELRLVLGSYYQSLGRERDKVFAFADEQKHSAMRVIGEQIQREMDIVANLRLQSENALGQYRLRDTSKLTEVRAFIEKELAEKIQPKFRLGKYVSQERALRASQRKSSVNKIAFDKHDLLDFTELTLNRKLAKDTVGSPSYERLRLEQLEHQLNLVENDLSELAKRIGEDEETNLSRGSFRAANSGLGAVTHRFNRTGKLKNSLIASADSARKWSEEITKLRKNGNFMLAPAYIANLTSKIQSMKNGAEQQYREAMSLIAEIESVDHESQLSQYAGAE